MIEMPILQPPDILQDLLTEFRPMFDRRQYRQFCRYITASWVSPTRSVAHLNGITVEHTNQSNLNRFVRNLNTLDIFRRSVELINRYCTDPVLVLDDTVLQRSGKHIEGIGWVYDHSEGKTVWGMSAISAAISGSEGIFPLNMDIKPISMKKSDNREDETPHMSMSKITMQMAVIKRSVTAGLNFSIALFDSWYFASKLTGFLESLGKDWISEAKSNRKILVDGKWIRIGEYEESLDIKSMKCYTIDGKQYFTKSIITRMKKIGEVRIVVSRGTEGKKFFVTNMVSWKPKRVMEMYLRRWDIEIMHREIKQDGLERIYQRVFAGIVSTTKLSLLGDLLLEISAMVSLGTQLKIGKGTPGLRFRSMTLRLLQDLFVALKNNGSKLMDAILVSIGKPYLSTIGVLGG